MPTNDEIRRLAGMAHALRPDWPVESLVTYLASKHPGGAYRDLAVALACVAADPATKTPARLGEAGPWWSAAQEAFAGRAPTPVGRRVACPRHPDQSASRCRVCEEEASPPPAGWRPTLPKVDLSSPEWRRAQAATSTSTLDTEGAGG